MLSILAVVSKWATVMCIKDEALSIKVNIPPLLPLTFDLFDTLQSYEVL